MSKGGFGHEEYKAITALLLLAEGVTWGEMIPDDMKTIIEDQAKRAEMGYAKQSASALTTSTVAHWMCSSSILGLMVHFRRLPYARSITVSLVADIIVAAGWARAPILSPFVAWSMQKVRKCWAH